MAVERASPPLPLSPSLSTEIQNRMRSSRKQHRGATWRTGAGVVFLAAMAAGWGMGRVPLAVVAGYGVVSLIAFLLYRRDKRAAQAGHWRTRERTLHLVDLAGGWPGGLVAQGRFHHKTRKTGFQFVFWLTAALHCAALAWWLARSAP